MDDPQVVMAAAAVVSAVFALGALVVSILGFLRSGRAQHDAQEAREDATNAQWKMSEHLEAIAEAQAQAASNLAGGGSTRPRQRGRLSARVTTPSDKPRLIVANVGTELLQIERVRVEDVGEGTDLYPPPEEVFDGAELAPGEDLSLRMILTLASPATLSVHLSWTDSDGPHEREQQISLV